jgi:hypothetical protein
MKRLVFLGLIFLSIGGCNKKYTCHCTLTTVSSDPKAAPVISEVDEPVNNTYRKASRACEDMEHVNAYTLDSIHSITQVTICKLQ